MKGDIVEGIADYKFVRSLGDAGHGAMFVAVPPSRLNAPTEYVGVKVLSGMDDETALRRATRELRAFAAVNSPYLVALLDAGRQGANFFYAMEYCPGGSLASPSRPLQRGDILRAVAQAARAAHALHEAGMIHRGIKPSNVLLTHHDARLADLGLVQSISGEHVTTALGAMSSVEYIEPAVLSGQAAKPSSDIWSLGVTLHRALSGEGPYGQMPENDPLLCVRKVLRSRPTISVSLDATEAALVARCLADQVEDRPATALELAEALERVL